MKRFDAPRAVVRGTADDGAALPDTLISPSPTLPISGGTLIWTRADAFDESGR